ncbi:hypothetical protein BOW53_09110 [Solemya pervernicosa gill symbiont]|uniref:Phospholipase/carboxylesterase/thioesterase domain-containing protein n=2 Tax=Gammaproteobacteria incertae sedis TaxID=118884 RepID=A0A1T2L4S7_9GAMM|nr:dienelactone hydrolase family protein [Candidatus Reidiella endopervernicosa]OOZ40103.1 hypothetical protein BOW53_09110 [Solemya pervernicosa gill symbiont]QKQ25422.1 dienelactone hydrolase family protein [Candidatus Reidiella endopervernicosa]
MTFQIPTIREPQQSAEYTIIWLHGLGANHSDMVLLADALELSDRYAIRTLFPDAPYRAVTMNGGYEMRAWFDVISKEPKVVQSLEHVEESQRYLNSLIETEIAKGIPCEHIYLAGFSQGGAIALYTSLRSKQRLGGVIALSTYLPFREQIDSERASENRNSPIFYAHGTEDSIIPYAAAELTREKLTALNYSIDWHSYEMGHSVSNEEIEDLREWFIERLI